MKPMLNTGLGVFFLCFGLFQLTKSHLVAIGIAAGVGMFVSGIIYAIQANPNKK